MFILASQSRLTRRQGVQPLLTWRGTAKNCGMISSILVTMALAACSPSKDNAPPSAADQAIEKFVSSINAGTDLSAGEKADLISRAKAIEATTPDAQKLDKIRVVASDADMLANVSKFQKAIVKQYKLSDADARAVAELALYKVDLNDPKSVRRYAELNYAVHGDSAAGDALKAHEVDRIAAFLMTPEGRKSVEAMNAADPSNKADTLATQMQDRNALKGLSASDSLATH